MPSIEEVSREVATIRQTSDELSYGVGAAGSALAEDARRIAAITRGSATGSDAAASVNAASRSLGDAATSMRALLRTCDDCIANLAK